MQETYFTTEAQDKILNHDVKNNFNNKIATVIGGGIAGTSIAYSLAKRGWKINLIERNPEIAMEASGNMAGVCMPMITNKVDTIGQFYLEGFFYSLQHFEELRNSGNKIIWKQCGVLEMSAKKVAKNPKELVMTLELIAKVNEKLASKISGIEIKNRAMYLPDAGFVSPKTICAAQINSMKDNISLKNNKSALSFRRVNNSWQVVDNNENIISESEVLVIANANDANSFEQCSWIPIQNVRGQITYLPETKNTKNLQTVLCANGYMTPSINGVHCIGATFDRLDDNKEILEEDHEKNINNFQQYIDISEINYKNIKGRVAFRTSSPDRRPVIGSLPNKKEIIKINNNNKNALINTPIEEIYHKGVYISLGHGSRGIVSAPISGEYLASKINDDNKTILEDKYAKTIHPARFILR